MLYEYYKYRHIDSTWKETILSNTAPQQILKISNGEGKEVLMVQGDRKSSNTFIGKSKCCSIRNIIINDLNSALEKFRLMK